MRKTKFLLKFVIIILTAVSFSTGVLAATGSADIDKEKIEKIKEKVTSQAAKLKGGLEKVTAGFLKEIKEEELILEEEALKIRVDPKLTRYFNVTSGRVREIEKDALEKGDYVFAVGPELDNGIDALEVYKDNYFETVSGIIVEIDKKNYSLRVVTDLKKEIIVDVEKKTRQYLLEKGKKGYSFERIGFSKIKENDSIIFVYKKQGLETKDRVSATRVLIIPQELLEGLRAEKVNQK